MKALVISGGGSKGAFAGGVAEYLINGLGNKYDLFVGSSTGSLLIPHLSIGRIDKIKKIYTSITNKDIFNISPFIIKETKNGFITKIHHFNILRNFLRGGSTFGESQNLRKLISNSLTFDEFEEIRHNQARVVFTLSNLTYRQVEYVFDSDCNYEDFCDWAWASANYVPFMSVMKKNDCQYADGGFGSHIPIFCAMESGALNVDVIILDAENSTTKFEHTTNPFGTLMRAFTFMSHQIGIKDILIGKLRAANEHININLYHVPEDLTDNSLFFNPEQMEKWWQMGYNYAKNNEPVRHFFSPE